VAGGPGFEPGLTESESASPATARERLRSIRIRSEGAPQRMSDVELQDALNEMKDRCFGLEVASAYFTDDDIMARGLTRLVAAVANQMAEIARA
jgi:hypothetical protein